MILSYCTVVCWVGSFFKPLTEKFSEYSRRKREKPRKVDSWLSETSSRNNVIGYRESHDKVQFSVLKGYIVWREIVLQKCWKCWKSEVLVLQKCLTFVCALCDPFPPFGQPTTRDIATQNNNANKKIMVRAALRYFIGLLRNSKRRPPSRRLVTLQHNDDCTHLSGPGLDSNYKCAIQWNLLDRPLKWETTCLEGPLFFVRWSYISV